MAKYNILIDTDANPDDESGIQKATADYNAFQQPPPGFDLPPVPALSAQEFLEKVVSDLVIGYTGAFFRAKAEELGAKFEKADTATRQEVEDVLEDVVLPSLP